MVKKIVFGLMLLLFVQNLMAQEKDTIDDKWWPKEQVSFSSPEQLPYFPGGVCALKSFVKDHLVYPQSAREAGVEGRVFVGFWVMKDGSLDHFKVQQSLGYGCDEAALEVFKEMPKWEPAKNHDVPMDYQYVVPVDFKLEEKDFDDQELIIVVEEAPVFPGKLQGLLKFIDEHLVYPKEAKNAGVEGKVYVSFIVEKDGSLSSIQLEKGIGYGCDEAAIDVVKKMPKWKPAMQRGKPVRMQYMIPLVFNLADEN